MTETWATTYCLIFGLFALVKSYALEIYLALIFLTLGMILQWYLGMMIS